MSGSSERIFDEAGVRFAYPDGWEVTREEYPDNQVAITVQSAGAAFWSLTLFPDRPSAEHVAASTVDVFREEYAELDEYPAEGTLCGHPCAARDIQFMYADTVSSLEIRSLRTDRMTVLVMCQWTDHEEEFVEPHLRSMTESLEVGFGDDVEIV